MKYFVEEQFILFSGLYYTTLKMILHFSSSKIKSKKLSTIIIESVLQIIIDCVCKLQSSVNVVLKMRA